jgi:hypothetical protein
VVCALVAALATAVGGLAQGGPAAVGALTGVGLAVFSYVVSSLAIAWADSVNPRLVFPVGMVAYLTKFTLFGLIMVALLDAAWSGITAHAMGIVAGVVAWTATQIWWVSTKGRPRLN